MANAFEEEKPSWNLSPKIHYGLILKHRPIISQLTYQNMYGIALDLERNYALHPTSKIIQQFGVSSFCFNYRNDVIGKEIGVFPYYKLKINRLGVRVGVGLGYFTKKFDRKTNYENLFISSTINGIIHVQCSYETKYFNTGISFTHASNGAIKMPNLGINAVTLSIGKNFKVPQWSLKHSWVNDTLEAKGKKGLIFELNNSVREVFPTHGKKYWVGGFSVLGYKNVGKIIAITSGIDYFYNSALLKEQQKENLGENAPSIHQLGLNLGSEILLGKITATLQYGYTFYNPYNFDGKIYSKLGLKYRINQHFYSGVRLKANGGKADFVEWTLHYKI